MVQLLLPRKSIPYPFPQDEREELMNKLYHLRVMVPGANDLEIEHLRDLVQYQEKKANDKVAQELKSPLVIPTKLTVDKKEEIKELLKWRKQKFGF